jgi:arsenite methyltransferase
MPLDPFPVTLAQALDRIDRTIGIAGLLADQGQDRVAAYYAQSRIGYDRLHSGKGCMHVALNPDGRFDRKGFQAQPKRIGRHLTEIGAKRVLELGAGLGFNARHLARAHPAVAITALDLLPDHVARITRDARDLGLTNLTALQGSHQDLPPGLGRFDLIFAVETLCYATDPARVAAGIATHLSPGGRFILFDPLATADEDGLSPPMALATRLYRLGVALPRPLWRAQDWHHALTGAGLRLRRDLDLTEQALPGLRVLQDRALDMTATTLKRLAFKAMPRHLAGNLATALTGPFICFGPGPLPDARTGSIAYRCLIAQAPA